MFVCPAKGNFYQLSGLPASAQRWVKYDVPSEYRYFSAEGSNTGYWYVHEKYLLGAIELSYTRLGTVDYSCLPTYLQMKIAREKENWTVNTPDRDTIPAPNASALRDAYAQLYLLADAPINIVNAAWKTLAKESHPDQGGDAGLFRKYSEAYETIKKESK
jgi:hypothetical protein